MRRDNISKIKLIVEFYLAIYKNSKLFEYM